MMLEHESQPGFQTEQLGGRHVIRVIGEVDVASSPRLAELIGEYPTSSPVVVDLSECTYLDSSVLSVLAIASKARRKNLAIVVPPEARIRKIFKVTKLDEALDVRPSLDGIE